MLTHDDIVTYVTENYEPIVSNQIAIDDASGKMESVIRDLFDLGYYLKVASQLTEDIDAINRHIYQLSGSMYRYKYVPYSSIYVEPAKLLITTNPSLTKSDYAESVYNVSSTKTEPEEPISTETEEAPKRRGRKPKQ